MLQFKSKWPSATTSKSFSAASGQLWAGCPQCMHVFIAFWQYRSPASSSACIASVHLPAFLSVKLQAGTHSVIETARATDFQLFECRQLPSGVLLAIQAVTLRPGADSAADSCQPVRRQQLEELPREEPNATSAWLCATWQCCQGGRRRLHWSERLCFPGHQCARHHWQVFPLILDLRLHIELLAKLPCSLP